MNAPSIDGFVSAAERFCKLSANDAPVRKEDLWHIRELLLLLVFHVPAIESHQQAADFDGKEITDEEFQRAVKRFGDLPFDFYRVVFNPHDFESKDEPVTGMLADDLSDIYRDLSEGLDSAQNEHLDDACFSWSQSYKMHWARHAVSALAAIELYRTDNYEMVEPVVSRQ